MIKEIISFFGFVAGLVLIYGIVASLAVIVVIGGIAAGLAVVAFEWLDNRDSRDEKREIRRLIEIGDFADKRYIKK